jgi:hypothetical protein
MTFRIIAGPCLIPLPFNTVTLSLGLVIDTSSGYPALARETTEVASPKNKAFSVFRSAASIVAR